jgi:hypothetical protein
VQVDDEAVGNADGAFVIDGSSLSDAERDAAIGIAEVAPWPSWELGSS